MAIIVSERAESPRVKLGIDPRAERHYFVRGTDDELLARQRIETDTPLLFDVYGDNNVVLRRDSIDLDPTESPEIWDGIVTYYNSDKPVFSFDTTGGTQHITHSLETVQRYGPDETPPDFQGAIGVTDNGVEGIDVIVPEYGFSLSVRLAHVFVTPAYRATLSMLTGCVNSTPFWGFAAGEVQFLGASGTERGLEGYDMTFRFRASPNRDDIAVGEITGIAKRGWEYLWVRYSDQEDENAKALVKRPVGVYIERVYPTADFTALGI